MCQGVMLIYSLFEFGELRKEENFGECRYKEVVIPLGVSGAFLVGTCSVLRSGIAGICGIWGK